MYNVIEKITFHSEDGNPDFPGTIKVKMDGSTPDCCVTLYTLKGKPVFSMGSHEVEDFCKALQSIAADS